MYVAIVTMQSRILKNIPNSCRILPRSYVHVGQEKVFQILPKILQDPTKILYKILYRNFLLGWFSIIVYFWIFLHNYDAIIVLFFMSCSQITFVWNRTLSVFIQWCGKPSILQQFTKVQVVVVNKLCYMFIIL